jgi:hypothetical protein
MTEGHTFRGLQAPVRDSSALTLGCLHKNTELSLLAGLDGMSEYVAFAGLCEISVAQGTRVVDVEHVVATNVSYTASSWPGVRAWVAQSPYLNKLVACTDLGTVNDGISNEVCVKALGSGIRSGNGDSFRLDGHCRLDRLDRLLLHWLYRVDEQITNSDLLLLDLRLC